MSSSSLRYLCAGKRALSRPCLRGLATTQRPLAAARHLPVGSSRGVADSAKIMLEQEEGFGFIRHNPRPQKPRTLGVTEIRGPYYSAMGKRYLQDVFDTCVCLVTTSTHSYGLSRR